MISILSTVYFLYLSIVNYKKIPKKKFYRSKRICEICNGTGNSITPRNISNRSNAKYKCLICSGTGILKDTYPY